MLPPIQPSINRTVWQDRMGQAVFQNDSSLLDHSDLSRTVLASVYAILSLGLLANLAVASLVAQILLARNHGASDNCNMSFGSNQNAHILVYILALSVVDSLVLVNAGVVSTTIFFQRWIFPPSMCTAYYAIDSVNKTLSTFILTCMSLDRFLAVRYPQKRFRIRSFKGATAVLLFCLLSAFVLLLPVYVQTDVIQVPLSPTDSTPTCAFVGETDFAVALAVFGFFGPLVLMTLFYGGMLSSLQRRRKRLERGNLISRERSTVSACNSSTTDRMQTTPRRTTGRVRTVTTRTLLLVLFHFGCWTPYWLATFYVMFSVHDELNDSDVIVMYVVHIGTYLNSAANPILYALLNRDLRRRRRNTVRRKRRRRAAAIEASFVTE